MSANFNPNRQPKPNINHVEHTRPYRNYTGQHHLRFWCNKILPLVYDDSLSYLELLYKVIHYLNNVINDMANVENNFEALANSYEELELDVNNNFDNLTNGFENLQTSVLTAYDQLQNYVNHWFDDPEETWLPTVQSQMIDVINDWLTDHPEATTTVDFRLTDLVLDTVQDMVENTRLKNGDKIRTIGYYETGDEGGAYYIVRTEEPSTHYEQLNNGLYAELVRTGDMNVKMYGAKPIESFDSTQAIRQCINENDTVYITNGTYYISEPIEVHGNLKIFGNSNGELRSTTEMGALLYTHDTVDVENLTVDGLILTGNVLFQDDVEYPVRTRVYKNSDYGKGISHGIVLYGKKYQREEKTKLLKNVVISNCVFQDIDTLPLLVCGCEGKLTIDNNRFTNNMDVGIIDSEHVFVTNNSVKYSYDNGISISSGNENVVCTGNVIEVCCYTGLFVSGWKANGVQYNGPKKCIISNNMIRYCGYHGIECSAKPQDLLIQGNKISEVFYAPKDKTTTTIDRGVGIYISSINNTTPTDFTNNVYIKDNTLSLCERGGIYFVNGINNVFIDNNLFEKMGSETTASGGTIDTTNTSFRFAINFTVDDANIDTHTKITNNVFDNTYSVKLNYVYVFLGSSNITCIDNIILSDTYVPVQQSRESHDIYINDKYNIYDEYFGIIDNSNPLTFTVKHTATYLIVSTGNGEPMNPDLSNEYIALYSDIHRRWLIVPIKASDSHINVDITNDVLYVTCNYGRRVIVKPISHTDNF